MNKTRQILGGDATRLEHGKHLMDVDHILVELDPDEFTWVLESQSVGIQTVLVHEAIVRGRVLGGEMEQMLRVTSYRPLLHVLGMVIEYFVSNLPRECLSILKHLRDGQARLEDVGRDVGTRAIDAPFQVRSWD